jgi:Methyltransferase domain
MDLMNAAMWDERYAGALYAYGLEPNTFLASWTAARVSDGRALVPGDGEGRNGVWLAGQGFEVDTLDLSEYGVAKARALAEARGLSLNALRTDALAWDWPPAHYDLIALIYLHLVEPQRRRLHTLAVSSLKPGGRIVLEAFRPEQIARQKAGARGGPRDAALLYSVKDLRADFAALQIEEIGEYEVDLREGALHLGPSAVVRMVARAR